MPRLSVVVAANNAADTLGAQLEALDRRDFVERGQLIIVDNASRDGTAEVVARWGPRMPHLQLVVALILEANRALQCRCAGLKREACIAARRR
jgi:glycosyltransferase involved in cell wall biosynthesis